MDNSNSGKPAKAPFALGAAHRSLTVHLLAIMMFFLACYVCTRPEYIGDTIRYASDAAGHAQGQVTQFWDFGHLLWRPWAYIGNWLFGGRYSRWFGDTLIQSAARFLVYTDFVCAMAVLPILWIVLRKVARPWVAAVTVLAMSCSIAFIDYSHSGAPYVPALLFSTLALFSSIRAVEHPDRCACYAIAAGVTFAAACGLWFPYAFTGLGFLAVLFFWPNDVPRHRPVALFLCSLTVVWVLLFSAGAAAKGIVNFTQFSQWIRESDNALQQSGRPMRAITGIPRALWSVGAENISLKRWLWSDPFNPAKLYQLWAVSLAAKLVLFYLSAAAVVFVLWREHRTALIVLAAAGIPVLAFAILLFEPSAPERFLPVFPFAFLAVAVVFETARRHAIAFICVAALLGCMTVVNIATCSRMGSGTRFDAVHRRIAALNAAVQPGALIFLLTFEDDLYRLPAQNPLSSSLVLSRLHVRDVVMLANRYTERWWATFAEQTNKEWSADREVWVSERLLAGKPNSDWRWVEGDDPRIQWRELPAAFSTLDYDERVWIGGDGFLRVARTSPNRERLAAAETAR